MDRNERRKKNRPYFYFSCFVFFYRDRVKVETEYIMNSDLTDDRNNKSLNKLTLSLDKRSFSMSRREQTKSISKLPEYV